jgi:DNA-binding beta-propeller fold protein YncE
MIATLLTALLALPAANGDLRESPLDRSPVDLVLSPDEAFLATANATSGTLSIVELAGGTVVSEVPLGRTPRALVATRDGRLLATASGSGELVVFNWSGTSIEETGRMAIGFEPWGVAVSPDGATAYVARSAGGDVAVVDLARRVVQETIPVGRWPRFLGLSPDGNRLAVGVSGDRGLAVVDTSTRKALFVEKVSGINLGHVHMSKDGLFAWFPWMVYRQNPINAGNIRQGWVLASRIARVKLDEHVRREAMSLDLQGRAVSDPYGLALTSDESWVVASASGTHELLFYRSEGLVLQDFGGPGDHIDPALAHDSERFFRVEVGGRPMAVRIGADDRTIYVANSLGNSVQVVDRMERAVVRTILLGGPDEPSLARKGEAIFYDGKRSLDQWYSCHSCHFEGETNAVTMDTLNDGTPRTYKTVLSLVHLDKTGPWTWHGWQKDLKAGIVKSMTETMQGPTPTDEDVSALIAFLSALEDAPNPFRLPDGSLSEAARRGEEVFNGEKAACNTCHAGPYFTDGEIHDVGLEERGGPYHGFNTPTLRGVWRKTTLLHDGRARSLEDVLTGPHEPSKVAGTGSLTDDELRDLVEFVKSL